MWERQIHGSYESELLPRTAAAFRAFPGGRLYGNMTIGACRWSVRDLPNDRSPAISALETLK